MTASIANVAIGYQQGKMYVLAFKSIIRILISTLGESGVAASSTHSAFSAEAESASHLVTQTLLYVVQADSGLRVQDLNPSHPPPLPHLPASPQVRPSPSRSRAWPAARRW